MRQVFYDDQNIKMLYLTPYCNIIVKQNDILFINTITDNKVKLNIPRSFSDKLCNLLVKGVTYDELVVYFNKNKIDNDFIILLMQEGIIV